MATSAMNAAPRVLCLDKFNHCRDMMSFPAPSKKPVCADHQNGGCKRLHCPYFHPKNLVVNKPSQPAQQKVTPATTRQPKEPTPNPTEPPTEPTPKVSGPKSPQPPKNDRKSAPPAVVPERQGQKTPPTDTRPVKLQTLQDRTPPTHTTRQQRPSSLASGPQTKTNRTSTMAPVKGSSNGPTPASSRSPTVVSSSVATDAITKDVTKPCPAQEILSGSSTSGTPPRRNDRRKKEVQKAENSTTELTLPPKSVSSEQRSSIQEPPVQRDKDVLPPKRYICRNYLHKRCSQDPCPHYHDPSLAKEPPLCNLLYDGPCLKRVCHSYHPENNRNRVVCRRVFWSECDFPNCRYYHFRLPTGENVAPVKQELPVPGGGTDHPPVTPPASKSLVSSTSSAHGAGSGRGRPQCPAWNDGYCPEGWNCGLLHLGRVVRWRMEAAQAAAKTLDRVVFDNTKVVFGAGCEVKQVITALESCRVLISNLPARATKEALEEFLTRAGFDREAFYVLVLRISVDRNTQEASVIFDDVRHAKTVVEVLDKEEYFGGPLKFELAPAVKPGQMDDWTYNRSSYLEITFNAPSKYVQVIYPTVEDAINKVKALNGGECGGRNVCVTMARPPKPPYTWRYIKNSIIISNVNIDTLESEIQEFAEPFSMKMFGHRWFKVGVALQRLEEHMRTLGGLKPGDFDVTRDIRKGKIFVRGRFDAWEQADRVWQSLQETELEFLARDHAQIFLAFPHQYSLHVPLEHYDAQKEIYDRLERQHGRDRTAHIVATRFSALCLIQVVGIDKKAVGALKLKVERIARGEVVEVWDRYFVDWQGEAFFGRLSRQFGAYVRPDKTKQVLRVYGSEEAVRRARREIGEQMKTLAALDYQMTIEDHCIGFFIHTGMEVLGDLLGEDNVWFHTTSRPYFVSVRGGHDAEHALQKLVSEALKRPLRPPLLDRSQTCPLCFEEPTKSFPLACRHVYCNGCLKHLVISATDGKNLPIRCIGNQGRCKTPISLPVIERFISPARLSQLFENAFRVYLEQHPNEYRFCPTPDCTQIYRVSREDSAVIQCPACLIETCSHCHKTPHRGLTCEESTLIGSKSGQELLLDRWAKGHSNVKKCPDCGVLIEKVDGCNHIHCRCGGHVCWICAKTFNNGIYDHLNAVHGGAYDADH